MGIKVNKKALIIVSIILIIIGLFLIYSANAFSYTKEQSFNSDVLINKTFVSEYRALRFNDDTNGEAITTADSSKYYLFTYEINKSTLVLTYTNNSQATFLICNAEKLWSTANSYFLYYVEGIWYEENI